MLFQKFTILVALMVFTSQGAVALPYPARIDLRGLDTDNLSENAADLNTNIVGEVAGSAVPAKKVLIGAAVGAGAAYLGAKAYKAYRQQKKQ
ncbi:hypothetical protein BYT27DRAFT_7200860 [Phlegmacium glaucopus]|nr:hypothetical protein BYT27DRAFT_7200860 [Phlegmacium glaucopus]